MQAATLRPKNSSKHAPCPNSISTRVQIIKSYSMIKSWQSSSLSIWRLRSAACPGTIVSTKKSLRTSTTRTKRIEWIRSQWSELWWKSAGQVKIASSESNGRRLQLIEKCVALLSWEKWLIPGLKTRNKSSMSHRGGLRLPSRPCSRLRSEQSRDQNFKLSRMEIIETKKANFKLTGL